MAGRRTSWIEVETETGEKYFYDDPNLGGTGVTQWDAPEEIQNNNNEKGQAPQKKHKHKLRSAHNSKHLRMFMKNKNKHHETSRERHRQKHAKLRSSRIARLRAARNGVGGSGGAKVNYSKYTTDDGTPYYVCDDTQQTVWDLPSNGVIVFDEDADESTAADNAQYETFKTDDGKKYYRNSITGETSWELPEDE